MRENKRENLCLEEVARREGGEGANGHYDSLI